jgi:transposase-like protein
MNITPKERQIQVLKALVEGNSIRSIERMTGIHRDTIMRLLVRSGDKCQKIMDVFIATEFKQMGCGLLLRKKKND